MAVRQGYCANGFQAKIRKELTFFSPKPFVQYVQILHSLRTQMPTGWKLALWSCPSPCIYLGCDISMTCISEQGFSFLYKLVKGSGLQSVLPSPK